MPSEVEKIDDYNYVLTHLKYLKNLIFSKNLKTIPECSESSMESVVIPDQVKRIEESTFLGCENLKNVTNVKLKKPAYLKKIKDGSVVYYEARATVKASGKKAVTYKASKITKIKAKTSKITIKKGKTAKLQTRVYISKKLKKGYLDPELLKFTTSNKK